MAVKYYKEAAEFKKALQDAGITQLTPNNAENVEDVIDENGEVIYSFMNGPNADKAIFDFGDGIEEPQSNFNEHRLAVIRYVIESNLATALANYNNGGYQFTMPKLSEEDWATIMNNVSLISFLQGLSIGGKVYNGYSVINNNKNEEVVTENSIYLIEDVNNPNSSFHRITHDKSELEGLVSGSGAIGVFNIDLERRSLENGADNYHYYYTYRQLGCYSCYVTQTTSSSAYNANASNITNIYDYIDSLGGNVAKLYYTALGRERYSMYKVFRDPTQHMQQFTTSP